MSHLPEYYLHLVNDRGLSQGQAADRLALVQNAFASSAQRKWFFANLAADKGGKFGGGKKGGKGGKGGVAGGGGKSTPAAAGAAKPAVVSPALAQHLEKGKWDPSKSFDENVPVTSVDKLARDVSAGKISWDELEKVGGQVALAAVGKTLQRMEDRDE